MEVCYKELSLILPAKVNARRTNISMTVARAVETFDSVKKLHSDVQYGSFVHGVGLAVN